MYQTEIDRLKKQLVLAKASRDYWVEKYTRLLNARDPKASKEIETQKLKVKKNGD